VRRAVLAISALSFIAAACSDGTATTGPTSATESTDDVSGPTGSSGSATTEPATTVPTTTLPPTTTTTVPEWTRYPTYEVAPVVGRGQAITVSRVDTTDPVVFLTIDDGFERDPRIVELLRQRGAVATLFVLPGPLAQDPEYFAEFIELGGTINSHTRSHANLKGMPADQQAAEICGGVAAIDSHYWFHGPWMRPPYGSYDRTTIGAAASCGLNAVVMWRVTASEGILSTWGDAPIHPGDIILLHFRPTLYDDLLMVFAELDRLGLHVARLEDYLVVG